ncbi:hypothetical protein HSB1_41260 [Halogranum salarium B-1]|uniref:Mandelate racemase/muconate lactonizing enzyme N-terminal domain-containing protein n=1 Tax=Halogranum salarium B-1 TaxID=1210908 RepID=J2ZWM8_9EURY|nr:hypothetical protein HSB1_41260 [Halogranum salarium B-1]
MKIDDVEVIPISSTRPEGEGIGDARGFGRTRETTLLRVETDTGTVGWGEAFAPGRIVDATFEELFRDDVVGTAILDTADEKDCDHVFIAGRKRSPTGKYCSETLPNRSSSTSTGR